LRPCTIKLSEKRRWHCLCDVAGFETYSLNTTLIVVYTSTGSFSSIVGV
jgi:hypothetical protein